MALKWPRKCTTSNGEPPGDLERSRVYSVKIFTNFSQFFVLFLWLELLNLGPHDNNSCPCALVTQWYPGLYWNQFISFFQLFYICWKSWILVGCYGNTELPEHKKCCHGDQGSETLFTRCKFILKTPQRNKNWKDTFTRKICTDCTDFATDTGV